MNQGDRPQSRREALKRFGGGFGYLALAGLAASEAAAATATAGYVSPLAPKKPHFEPKAKRVLFLFMEGGPSQYETFGGDTEFESAASSGATSKLLAPIYKFAKRGDSGIRVSELFPRMATQVDKLCVVKALHTDSAAHPQATVQMHTGSANFVRPSFGSWVLYGLGTENQNLPGFLSINPGFFGGAQNYGSAFLPASYQGTPYVSRVGTLPNVANPLIGRDLERTEVDFIQGLNRDFSARVNHDNQVEGLIESYELAFRMQSAVPGMLNFDNEPESMRKLYGLDLPATKDFGTQCILARRLLEGGVRFVELTSPGWDHHTLLKSRIAANSRQVDRPVAGLLEDLDQRGLLKDTLVLWGGEFGRTTTSENATGRGHNNRGFMMWMAGGGVKPGIEYGVCDPVTGSATADTVHLHDLHATILHLLGFDHEKLTYRFGGRDYRLTDVAGKVVREILA